MSGPLAEAITPDDVEETLRRYAVKEDIPLSLDESRPLEVHLVDERILWLLAARPDGAGARKERECADGTRCDIVVPGEPSTVFEFSTQRGNIEKARQLLGYVKNFRRDGRARRFQAVLVAVLYESDALSREIHVDGEPVEFENWHDFIRGL